VPAYSPDALLLLLLLLLLLRASLRLFPCWLAAA
jgi:hypothetical protein